MIDHELSIIAENAGNSAAVIVAAAIAAGHVPEGEVIKTFDRLREHIFATTVSWATVDDVPASTGGPRCKHGARVTRKGTSAKGPWVGHFCSLDKDDPDRCEPVFDK